jgi:hypothetical protein
MVGDRDLPPAHEWRANGVVPSGLGFSANPSPEGTATVARDLSAGDYRGDRGDLRVIEAAGWALTLIPDVNQRYILGIPPKS